MATDGDSGQAAAARAGLLDMLQTSGGDPQRLVAFYRDALGADVEAESDAWSQVRLGGVSIGIHGPGASHEGWMPAFRVGDIAAVRARLEAAGAEVAGYHDIPGGVTLRLTDPAGHQLAVTQYGTTVAQLRGEA